MQIPAPPAFPAGTPPEPQRNSGRALFNDVVMGDNTLIPQNITFSSLDPVLKAELDELDRMKRIAEAQHAILCEKNPIVAERYMRDMVHIQNVKLKCIQIYANAAIGAARVAVHDSKESSDPASRAVDISSPTFDALANAIVSAQRGGPR